MEQPKDLIAFSSLSVTVVNAFGGLVDLHVFIMVLLVERLLWSDKT